MKAATAYAAQLSETELFGYNLGLLHGKMTPKQKDAVMQAFARGDVQVLVATTVVEVGVDVPNATVMIVENAERFGLSQLHQLRGRIGRGSAKSYCILVSDAKGDTARQRLLTMKNTVTASRLRRGPAAARPRRLLWQAAARSAGAATGRYGGGYGHPAPVPRLCRHHFGRRPQSGQTGKSAPADGNAGSVPP